MSENTIADWQSLTKLYGEMGDEELLELDSQINDLTELAQQVLRDEMKKRGLARPRPADNAPKTAARFGASQSDRREPSPFDQAEEDGDPPDEYTWKTVLCECNERKEVYPIRMALWHAGIESWIGGRWSRYSDDARNRRILVAADQLDQAREVIARPIPDAVVEECREAATEFKVPICPKCGAEDPILENAEPVNSWRCEECGRQWTDPAPPAE